MTEHESIKLFKCLADKSRLQILKSLMKEEMYVGRLAERLDLTPATISFHLKKLEDAGAVTSRKEQYYTMYAINRHIFEASILDILKEESTESVLQNEREVNIIIADFHDDFCTIRRDMISEGLLERENMVYRRKKI